jgi:hypothetical protein
MDDTDLHLGMYNVFVIGKCIDAANDIVYLNFFILVEFMQYATQHGGRLAASGEWRCHF